MKLFIDTANVEKIKEINELGVVDGVTTNPSLVSKEGKDFKELIKEISEIVDGPISAEVISLDAPGMIKEARELCEINKNIVIKIPMTKEGLKAVKILSSENIKTNVTLIFSINQALLAVKAGATYVSPFIGRLEDIGSDGLKLVEDLVEIFNKFNIETEIIAASLRSTKHVEEVAKVGSHIATIPYEVFIKMINHPLTDSGIEQFLSDWNK
ncbi:MAG TPA: fructose-6-phosphate aldolase [Tissierellaceae bacterium]